VVLTSATVASVGLGLTIPLAFVSDIFIGLEDVVNFESIFGAGFVLVGFICVNIGQKQEESSLSTRETEDAGIIQPQMYETTNDEGSREISIPVA